MRVHGTLLTTPDKDGMVEVQIGSIRSRVATHDIEASSAPTKQSEQRTAYTPRTGKPTRPPVEEISLRGMRYEAAEQLLEKTLDDAFLANTTTLRVIHGKGTGILKQMTHEMLDQHPLVESHHMAPQPDGGNGVTIARLSSHPE
jgi:DNA mismatch repair protein MutS2